MKDPKANLLPLPVIKGKKFSALELQLFAYLVYGKRLADHNQGHAPLSLGQLRLPVNDWCDDNKPGTEPTGGDIGVLLDPLPNNLVARLVRFLWSALAGLLGGFGAIALAKWQGWL